MFYFIFIYFLSYFILLISGNRNESFNELIVNIEYGENNTFILYYNLTTNYSYYLTFRLFEHEQIKLGLFSPTYQQTSIEIFNQYDSSTISTLFYLIIICFHFIRQLNDIDIQCKDIRLLKNDHDKTSLPSYKPLFVPMMYTLSILMILPVIIQHRRDKQAKLIERRKQLRRLSITIMQDNPNILSSGNKTIPIQIELASLPSTRTFLEEINDNDNAIFSLQQFQPLIDKYGNEESDVTADNCIAHLLNNTPWNSSAIQRSSIKRDPIGILKEEHIPMITTFYTNDDEDERQPILEANEHYTIDLFKSNPHIMDSDV